MIQDIQPKVYHNEYTPRPIRDADVVFVFRGREVLLREENGNFVFPRGKKCRRKTRSICSPSMTGHFFWEGNRWRTMTFNPCGCCAGAPHRICALQA